VQKHWNTGTRKVKIFFLKNKINKNNNILLILNPFYVFQSTGTALEHWNKNWNKPAPLLKKVTQTPWCIP